MWIALLMSIHLAHATETLHCDGRSDGLSIHLSLSEAPRLQVNREAIKLDCALELYQVVDQRQGVSPRILIRLGLGACMPAIESSLAHTFNWSRIEITVREGLAAEAYIYDMSSALDCEPRRISAERLNELKTKASPKRPK